LFIQSYPYLQYCVIVWGSTYPANLDRVVKLQKRLICCICRQPYDTHTDPLFKELKILKFGDIYLFNLGMFMFLYCNDLLPNAFRTFFQPVNRIHQYNTRSSRLLCIPFCRTIISRRVYFTGHGSQVTDHGSRITGHGSGVTGHGSQVTGHRSRVTGHGSQVTGHRSRVTGHGSQVTGRGSQIYEYVNTRYVEFIVTTGYI
jgi:hypothetical protein